MKPEPDLILRDDHPVFRNVQDFTRLLLALSTEVAVHKISDVLGSRRVGGMNAVPEILVEDRFTRIIHLGHPESDIVTGVEFSTIGFTEIMIKGHELDIFHGIELAPTHKLVERTHDDPLPVIPRGITKIVQKHKTH